MHHSNNHIDYPGLKSNTVKSESKHFHPITRIEVYTTIHQGSNLAMVSARWDAMLPFYDDDTLRLRERAFLPTPRQWKLSHEEDAMNWLHIEVSNMILGAFAREYPSVLQRSHKPPFREQTTPETVDIAYSVKLRCDNVYIVISKANRKLSNFEQ